ncbi:MAG: Mut7-C RNAse domain-containing protein [bacterium]
MERINDPCGVGVKFLVDCMLGRLATWLRILGFDASYYPEPYSRKICYTSIIEKRIILTRNKRVSPKRSFKVMHINYDLIQDQIKQVVSEYKLTLYKNRLFSRCSYCNQQVQETSKSKLIDIIPEYVYNTNDRFSQCPACKKIYWPGTHEKLLCAHLANLGIHLQV